MQEIKIRTAKGIADECGYDGVIILGFSNTHGQHVTTYGKTVQDSKCMAEMGNHMKEEMEWPAELCHAEPTKRICSNCSYYQPKRDYYHDYRLEGGLCFYDVDMKEREGNSRACHNFEGIGW